MKIALSYTYSAFLRNDYLEQTLAALGHTVFFVGPPADGRPGYGLHPRLGDLLRRLPEPPDLFLCIDPSNRYFPLGVEELEIPTVCWLGDIHLGAWRKEVAKFFDLVLLPHADYLPAYRQVVGHDQVEWLPLYLSPRVAEVPGLARVYEVGFVGNTAPAHRATPRARRLELLRAHFRMNEQMTLRTPAQMSEIYSQSKLVFNNTINGDLNLRLFEGAACGALLLTDATANGLPDCFEVGRELVVYQDDQDLLDKVRHYLAHAEERQRIATAGQRRTLTDHTYAARATTLLTRLAQPIAARAPMRTATPTARYQSLRRILVHLHALDTLLDEARSRGRNPLQRAVDIFPCLVRRLFR